MGKSTYVAVGNREDLSDLITNISPKDTPFYTMCGKGVKVTSTKHEWIEDSLRAPAANAQIEGFDYVVADPAIRVRLNNVTQIFSVGYGVTATQEVVQKAGLTSEIGYQMQKAMKEIALDIEQALITQAAAVPGSATTARQMMGAPGFITTNEVAAGGAITEDLLNDCLQQCWQQGGTPSQVFVSGAVKRAVSAWTGNTQKFSDQTSKKLIQQISVYESDFGIVTFIPHRFLADDTALVIDTQFWKVGYLRPIKSVELPKTSDSWQRVLVGELTLEARAEKASGKITGITV